MPDNRTSTTRPRRTTVLRRRCEADRFTIIPNDTIRDTSLSFAARGVLADMLSRPDDWQFSADRIALGSDKDGRKLVLRCLSELEAAGYVKRQTERRDGGKFATVVMVSDRPVAEWLGETAGRTESPSRNAGERAAGEGTSKEVTNRSTDTNTEMRCLDSASQSRAAKNPNQPSWRDQDRKLFADLIGGNLKSDGTKWTKGTHTVDAFYRAYMKRRGKAWPGMWAEAIEDGGGLEYWLMEEGLEVVDDSPF